jgi:hypothetical protein
MNCCIKLSEGEWTEGSRDDLGYKTEYPAEKNGRPPFPRIASLCRGPFDQSSCLQTCALSKGLTKTDRDLSDIMSPLKPTSFALDFHWIVWSRRPFMNLYAGQNVILGGPLSRLFFDRLVWFNLGRLDLQAAWEPAKCSEAF